MLEKITERKKIFEEEEKLAVVNFVVGVRNILRDPRERNIFSNVPCETWPKKIANQRLENSFNHKTCLMSQLHKRHIWIKESFKALSNDY